MSNKGIVNFYYTQTLPAEAIAIAQISCADFSPSQLVGINNFSILDQGTLSLWKSTTPITNSPDFQAPALNQSIQINGDTEYYIDNQFFELTNIVSNDANPLYYKHVLPIGVTSAVILDASGNILTTETLLQNNILYHSQTDGYFQVRYVDLNGFVHVEMLLFQPVVSQSLSSPSVTSYTYTSKVLGTFTSGSYYIRFNKFNGYQILPPYNTPSNVPWFVRIRFGVSPTPPEWGNQPFLPFKPYLLGTWIQGKVLNSSVIQFERTQIYNNLTQNPDILVFDKNNVIKYALDGTPVNSVSTKGYEYPWSKGLISSVDNYSGRIEVEIDLDESDLVFGFYAYQEKDVVFTELDVNPFTNPLIKNSQATFYLKTNGIDPTHYLYYTLTDSNGNILQTNDISSGTGTIQLFSQIVVGASISTSQLSVTDIRQRGGGLIPSMQNIPEAANFWDLGFWDGKPYPAAGALLIYLPQSLLTTMTDNVIQSKIQSILPMGILAVIKYYNETGDEY